MTSRPPALVALALAAVAAVALTGCGGDDSGQSGQDKPAAVRTPDRSGFVPITAQGVAAVVQRHLGDAVVGYYTFKGDSPQVDQQLQVGVRLKGADARDTFLVTVYPKGGSGGEVVTGPCTGGDEAPDPQSKTACFPASGGGNVTVTTLARGLDDGNTKGRYVTASGTGPTDREATATYESYTHTPPITDQQLKALLGDPYLGWETAPKTNTAGQSLKIAQVE
jgi:hypothetical protein